MKLTAKPKYFITPNWNENLKLPENERVRVEILRPKAEDRGNLVFAETVQEIGNKSGGKDAFIKSVAIRTKFNVREILLNHVGKIENLVVEEDDKEVAICKGEDIANSTAFGLSRLIDIICAEVTSDILTASEKKSS